MIFAFLGALFPRQSELATKNLALSQQLGVLEHMYKRPRSRMTPIKGGEKPTPQYSSHFASSARNLWILNDLTMEAEEIEPNQRPAKQAITPHSRRITILRWTRVDMKGHERTPVDRE